MQAFLFIIECHCELASINPSHDKVKLFVAWCEKDALTWWNQVNASHTNALSTEKWDDFKSEVEHMFHIIYNELQLFRGLV